MKKSYSNFKTVDDIKSLGINMVAVSLFGNNVPEVKPSNWLAQTLEVYKATPSGSEKAKSELTITPIFGDLRLRNPQKFSFFSGYQLNVLPEKGLRGFCDFILSKKYNAVLLESPLLVVVEAKLREDLPDALPQCIAAMYAAQILNQRNDENLPYIYGVVTNGQEWLFVKLANMMAYVDTERYFTARLPQLLGVWQLVLDSFEK